MSNRNFDSRIITQRLQNQTYARNLYENNVRGKRLINNQQSTSGGAGQYNNYTPGAQSEYFRGLLGNGGTTSIGGIVNIPPYITPTASVIISKPDPSIIDSIITGNSQLTINFTPGLTGGSNITDYEYSTDNGITFISSNMISSPIVISGLINGSVYQVKIRAKNLVGTSSESNMIEGMPATFPTAPTISSIIAGNSQLTINFTPGSNGGLTITDYEYSINNGSSYTSAGTITSPIVITGLSNSTEYQVKIRAVNDIGAGTASTMMTGTLVAHVIPGTPTLTYILEADRSAYVYFNAGSGTVTNYEYTLDDGNTYTALSTSDIVSPIYLGENILNNEQSYNIKLRAVNSGLYSSLSNSLSFTPNDTSIPQSWLYFDPADASSYSGSGTTVQNIGTYGSLTGIKGAAVNYENDITISRNIFNFLGNNGNSNLITFPQFNFGTRITATAWIYPRTKANINGLLANTTANVNPSGFKFQWNWWLNGSRVIGMQAGNGAQGADNYTVTNTIEYDKWQHISYVFDQFNRKIIFFKNGIPIDMMTSVEPVANIGTNQPFNIGGYIGGSYTMNAKLGYIKVFNTLLTASQILEDYNNTKIQFGL